MEPASPDSSAAPSEHVVQFYDCDSYLVESVGRFVGAGLGGGDTVVVIATEPHRVELEKSLVDRGLDVGRARAEGRYVAMDAAATLSQVMLEGLPDPQRFADVVGGTLRQAAAAPASQVRAFGEMVTLLWADGKPEAALRLEELWNDLARELPFSLLCAYPIGAFQHPEQSPAFREICDAHGGVIPAEIHTALASPEERRRAIAHLQQQVGTLEAEIARRRLADHSVSRLAAIVESSDDAIIGKTLDGVVTSWNSAAERIFGYAAAEMVGQPISRIIPPEQKDDFPRILGTIRRGERVEHFETVRLRKDGRRIHVSLTVSPIRDATGRVIGASKIARDVTERKRMDAEREQLLGIIQRAAAEAEEASRSKDEFLAMLAHELRNPLSAVRNAVVSARLDRTRLDHALEIACRQTEQLGRLVDDLLDMSRITLGRVRLNREPTSVAAILRGAVETTRFLIEDRGHLLSLSLPPDDLRVDGDPVRLEQVVVNLLNNAAKYTEPGGRIDLSAKGRNGEAVIRVRDSGIGIAPDMLARIFNPFVQAGRGLDRARGGLGIGLTVVRSFVTLHGGRVEAHSAGLGKGAEFVVRLPVSATSRAPAAPRETVAGSPTAARILVVEDNPDAAEGLMMLLEVFGHRVRLARDGPTALEDARADAPDVMLVDIGLPGMDGYEVARRVRQQPELRRVVLTALTGYSSEEAKRRTVAAGFDHHLVKPVDPARLRSFIAQVAPSGPTNSVGR
jgi:PAS domain S-box-containing protein